MSHLPPLRAGARVDAMAHRTAAGTPQVFISYRRSDAAGHAGRLHDAMVVRFGEQHVMETRAAAGDQPAGDSGAVSGPGRPSRAVLARGLSALAVVAILVVALGSGGGGGGDRTTASRPATNTASSETVRPPGVP